MPEGQVVGRDGELAAIDDLLGAAGSGAVALVVEGDAGIGKTTVWQAGVRLAHARGLAVLTSRPGPSEARLAFVGLADFLADVDQAIVDELPTPQRRALDVALLRAETDEPAPAQRVVSTAFLSVLRALARSSPVVVAVDDLQWLDTASRHVLEFALRRLEGEPVAFLAALRLEAGVPQRVVEGARRIRLGPLSVAALHEIMKAELGHTFARPVLVRIEQTSAGNPFFALELGRAILESGQPVHGSAPLPVPADLIELIRRRVQRLPAASGRELLVASTLSQPTLELLDAQAILPAEAAGIVRITEQGRVTFAHPLFAAAVYGSASAVRRQEVHRELAIRAPDGEERARHLALSARRADEGVAAALVEAARSARARGAVDAAIELLELACGFTPTELKDELDARRFELARALASGGDPRRAAGLLREVVEEAGSGPLRARAQVILAFLLEWEGTEAAVDLCEQALVDAADDVGLAAEIHAVTSRICDYDTERKVFHARAARELLEGRTPDPGLHAYVLLAVAEADFHAGRGIDLELFEQAARLESEAAASPGSEEPLLGALHGHSGVSLSTRLLAMCRFVHDDLDSARALLETELRVVSEEGDEAQVARTLWRLASLELKAGDSTLAQAHLRELEGVVERTGQEGIRCRKLALDARLDTLRGAVDDARSAGEHARRLALDGGDEWLEAEAAASLGFVELTAGRFDEARVLLDRVDGVNLRMGFEEPSLLRYQADRIEGLVALGKLGRAEEAVTRLEQQAQATGGPWALATGARCRGLLLAARGDLDAAAESLDRALVEHEALPNPFELGRTLLVKGQIHRRRNERRLAREALFEAIEMFDRLGAPLWAEKAQGEARRLGLRKGDRDELTPTEERIAVLAASGMTNRQIAERVFVSPKTVEANLSRVYRKLAIHSRAELGARMAERQSLTKT